MRLPFRGAETLRENVNIQDGETGRCGKMSTFKMA
jgi:hypothetical protein